MINLYNAIWVDAIQGIRRNHPQKKNWKLTIFIYMTWIMAINLWIVILWLEQFNIQIFPSINIDLFPGILIDEFISFSIEFALPLCLINYFLIFFRNRYQKLITKFDNLKYRYSLAYLLLVLGLALLSIVLHGIINN